MLKEKRTSCHQNVSAKKKITQKQTNIILGVYYWRIFGFHKGVLEPNSCEMRGLTVHELKYSTPTNTFGFAARRQNLDSDVSNFKISICKLTGLPLCSMQYNPKRRLKAVATATVRTTIAVKSDPVICSLGHKPIYLYKTQNIHRHVVCLVNLAASNTYSALSSWQRICLPLL